MDSLDFSDWLVDEMRKRGLSQAALARLAGVNRQVISTYINRKRMKPDEDILQRIAYAFGLPPETVFRAAGLLPPINPITEYQEILDFSLSTLDGDQLMEVLQFIEFIKQRDKQPVKQTSKPAKQNREGISPPETVK